MVEIDVAALRKRLGLSQERFAEKLNLSLSVLRSWEQGQRRPSAPARTLLALIARRPDALNDILR